MGMKDYKRPRIPKSQHVGTVDVEEMNGHVMLRGAEKFHCGGFIGMPVFENSCMSSMIMAGVYADGRTVILKNS